VRIGTEFRRLPGAVFPHRIILVDHHGVAALEGAGIIAELIPGRVRPAPGRVASRGNCLYFFIQIGE
jgi:hypothetical protein